MQFCPFFSLINDHFVRGWKTFLFLKLSAATTLHFHFTFTVYTADDRKEMKIYRYTYVECDVFPIFDPLFVCKSSHNNQFFLFVCEKIFFVNLEGKSLYGCVPLYFRWVNLCRFLRRFLPFWLRFWHVSLLNYTHEGQMCVWLMEI